MDNSWHFKQHSLSETDFYLFIHHCRVHKARSQCVTHPSGWESLAYLIFRHVFTFFTWLRNLKFTLFHLHLNPLWLLTCSLSEDRCCFDTWSCEILSVLQSFPRVRQSTSLVNWHMWINNNKSGLIWNIWVSGTMTRARTHTSQHPDQTTSGYPIILLLMYYPCFPSLLFSLDGYGLFRHLFSLTVRQLKANICSALRGDS